MNRREIEESASALGIHVATWSPGDGLTRYRFFRTARDYFSDDGLFTALGAKEAGVFLRGYGAGKAHENAAGWAVNAQESDRA